MPTPKIKHKEVDGERKKNKGRKSRGKKGRHKGRGKNTTDGQPIEKGENSGDLTRASSDSEDWSEDTSLDSIEDNKWEYQGNNAEKIVEDRKEKGMEGIENTKNIKLK